MAPPIQQQTGRLCQLTVAKFVFIFLLVLTAFQVINTHELRNVHDEQTQDSHDALPSSKYNPGENTLFQEVKKEDVSDGSYDFHKYDEHSSYQQNKVLEKHIREEHNNAEERSDNSGNTRYSHGTGKDRPRHNGQLVKPFGKRAGQSPNDAGDILEFLGPCWLKAITLTAVISTSPVIVLLLIPVENAATHKNLQKILLSFATGSLLGDAFFHMIPSAIMTSDHGDKEMLEQGHSHTDGHNHGHGFHSHDMTVGLSILSGIIVFLMADKVGQFLKYGRYDENEYVNVSSGGSLGSIDNSSSGKTSSTKRQDPAYAEKKISAKRIEKSAPEKKNSTKRIDSSSPEKKNSTNRIDSSSPEKKNSTNRIDSSSPEKQNNTKRIENSSLEKKNKAKRVENSSEKKSKARNQVNEASPEKQNSTKSIEDSSLRKRKGKGKHSNHKGKDRASERLADTNKEIETDMTTNKTHSETELYSKSEHRSEEKRVLSTNIQTAPAAYNPDIQVTGYLALVADFAYNFTDGLAIGASFMAGGSIGTVTSLTIFLHELSHEIGDFAILIQSGYSKGKAVLLQFLTAFGSLLGTVCSLTLQETTRSAAVWILPFTAGGFIYIALVSVIPDLLQKSRTWQSIKEILAMIIGVLLMLLVALYE